MELNLLKWVFSSMTVYFIVMGYLVNSLQERLPLILHSALRYGKFVDVGKSSQLKLLKVPNGNIHN
jgi:hypothetical protein